MREAVTRGIICVRDPETLMEYWVARITYTEYEDGTYVYSIQPNYSVIELLKAPLFQGIPGINLDLRRAEYVRENKTPVFVSERAPAENREDLWKLLDEMDMPYLNKLEWLIRTERTYSGDNLYVVADSNAAMEEVVDLVVRAIGPRSSDALRAILEAVCAGKVIRGNGFKIDDSNRVEMHALLKMLYVKEKSYLDARRKEGLDVAKSQKKLGRPSKRVDQLKLIDAIEKYARDELSAEEAARVAGVSRATLFRRMKAFGISKR